MMKKKIIVHSIIFVLLTVFSQVGGLVYLLWLLVHKKVFQGISPKRIRFIASISTLVLLYFSTVFYIVPVLAKQNSRVALPYNSNHIKASNFVSILLCRNYVKPETKKCLENLATEMNDKNKSEVSIVYLDACFPFFDGFPLLPHLSHNDGKKIDLAFLYKDKQSSNFKNTKLPNYIGYGMFEEPTTGEKNTAAYCKSKGNPLYSMCKYFTYRWNENLEVDEKMMRQVFDVLQKDKNVKRMFLEPHLIERWKLNSNKIHFHGCHAVRHDDHLHLEVW